MNPRESADRFRNWFPITAGFIRRPWQTFAVAVLLAAPLSFLSIHWALAPLCFWIFLWAMRIDGPLINRLLLPPLATLVVMTAIAVGLGVPIFADSIEGNFSRPHLITQVVYILGYPLLFLGYRLGRGKIRPDWWPAYPRALIASLRQPLHGIALFLCIFDVARLALCWQTGRLDRGYAGDVILSQGMGGWTFFEMFSRWHTIWFFFLPYLWRERSSAIRVFVVGAAFFCLLIALASGSRGLVIRPLIYVLCGAYFFSDIRTVRVERWVPLLVLPILGLIWGMHLVRSSGEFQNSRMTDLSARLSAVSAIGEEIAAGPGFAEVTGRALLGVSDASVYDATPNQIPFAGVADIPPALIWTWVPQLLAPNKPNLSDGNDIVVSYTGIRYERSYDSISLSADLYRRIGWPGLMVGLPILGVCYGLFVRLVLGLLRNHYPVQGLALLVLLVSGLQMPFTGTVLGTWWIFAYDLPKHVLPLAALIWLAWPLPLAPVATPPGQILIGKNGIRRISNRK